MSGHYDPYRVLLSLLISVLSAWSALELSGRVSRQRKGAGRALWLCSGAVAMGIGIWSMHYVGMLAYRMDMPVLYDWPTVLVSMLAAILASALALFIVSRKSMSWAMTSLGGLFMGVGIASMHYIGMAAMRMPMGMTYSGPLVVASVAAAVIISLVALRLTFGTRDIIKIFHRRKVMSAVLMGMAIPVMHYLGMAAAQFTDGPGNFSPADLRHALVISDLSTTAIVIVTGLVLAASLVSAGIDRHLAQYETELRGTEQRNQFLNVHNHRLQNALRASGVGIWECDPAAGLFYVDPHLRDMYEVPHDGKPVDRNFWKQRVHPEDEALLDQRWSAALASSDKYENEYRVVLRDGTVKRYHSVASIVRTEDGTVQRVIGMTWDVTEERAREQDAADQGERFRMTLEAIDDAVIAVDDKRRVLYMNPAASSMTGWGTEESVGKRLGDVFITRDENTDELRADPVQRCMDNGGTLPAEDVVLIGRGGERYNIRKHVALMDSGRAAVLTFQDVTAARQMERKLQYAATHDPLTGMLNRSAFEKQLDLLGEGCRSDGRRHCLCILDLDRFKIINDTSGHMAGDALLREIAGVMQRAVTHTGIVARMGGDEFMVLLVDTPIAEGQRFAERLLGEIAALRFPWQGKIYDVTGSLGIVEMHSLSPQPEMLISQADVATFTAKHNGRNQVSVYAEEGSAAGAYQEMQIVAELRRAIDENWFELYAQPIVVTGAADKPDYYELLIRMRNQQGEMVPPAQFIPAAERYGLMRLVDRWVVSNALGLYGPLCRRGCGLRFSINLSADSLSDPDLWRYVQDQFQRTGVSPSSITFEVTETGVIQDISNAMNFMRQAQEAGSQIALDDFGTGLSSLSYLKQFPLQVLKVDGAFVRQLTSSELDQTIVRSIAEIARSMQAVTVAECVEDSDTIGLLQQLGVDYVQGWATGRPVPFAKVLVAAEVQARDEQLMLVA